MKAFIADCHSLNRCPCGENCWRYHERRLIPAWDCRTLTGGTMVYPDIEKNFWYCSQRLIAMSPPIEKIDLVLSDFIPNVDPSSTVYIVRTVISSIQIMGSTLSSTTSPYILASFAQAISANYSALFFFHLLDLSKVAFALLPSFWKKPIPLIDCPLSSHSLCAANRQLLVGRLLCSRESTKSLCSPTGNLR